MPSITADRTKLTGIATPDPREMIITSSTVLGHSRDGAYPSIPQTDSELRLTATGDIPADAEYIITTTRAGQPGSSGAGFIWSDGVDTYGWNPPITIAGVEALVSTSAVIPAATSPHAITLDDGTLLVAHQVHVVAGSTHDKVVVRRRSGDGSWNYTDVWDSGTTYGAGRGAHPTMTQMPNGDVLLYHWWEPIPGKLTIMGWVSRDMGATWERITQAAIPAPVPWEAAVSGAHDDWFSSIGRLRVANKNGQVLLVATVTVANDIIGDSSNSYSRDTFIQWASADTGASFSLVRDPLSAYAWTVSPFTDENIYACGGYHDIVALAGAFHVVFVGVPKTGATTIGPQTPRIRTLGNAFEPLSASPSVELPMADGSFIREVGTVSAPNPGSYLLSSGDIAAAVDTEGKMWIYARDEDSATASAPGLVWRSTIGVLEFTSYDSWYLWNSSAPTPTDFSASFVGEHIAMITNDTGVTAGDLTAYYLGGFSGVTYPDQQLYERDPSKAISAGFCWSPIDIPSVMGWTGAGGGTGTLSAGSILLDGSAGALDYSVAVGVSAIVGISDEVTLYGVVDALTAGTVQPHYLRSVRADGTFEYAAELRVSAGSVSLHDVHGGSVVGYINGLGQKVELLLSSAGAAVTAWARTYTIPGEPAREWTQIGTTAALTSGGSPLASGFVSWGVDSGSNTATWETVSYFETPVDAPQLSQGWSTDRLMPHSYGDTLLVDSLLIHAITGPTYQGDEVVISPDFTFGLDAALEDYSPRLPWRYDIGDEVVVSFSDTTDPAGWPADTYAFSAISAPGVSIDIYGLDSTSSWVLVGSLESSEKIGTANRGGATLTPSNFSGTFLAAGELTDGDMIILDDGTNRMIAPVVRQTEGYWTYKSGVIPKIIIDLSAAVIDGTAPTTGDIYVLRRATTLVAHKNGKDYSAWRMVLDHAWGAGLDDSAYSIGRLFFGPVNLFGAEYSWGRSIEKTANVELAETPDWMRQTISRSKPRRVVSLAWQNGTDQTPAQDGDYLTGTTDTNNKGEAYVAGTPAVLDSILTAVNGLSEPVIYLANIPIGSTRATTQRVARPQDHLYCRISGSVRLEQIQGDTPEDEVVRVASIVLEEEL